MFLAVTDEAKELTISSSRKGIHGTSRPATRVTPPLPEEPCASWVIADRVGNNGHPMNVIVCVKQIPDPAVPGELNGSTNTPEADTASSFQLALDSFAQQANPSEIRRAQRAARGLLP